MVGMQPSHRALGPGMWQGQRGDRIGLGRTSEGSHSTQCVEGVIAVLGPDHPEFPRYPLRLCSGAHLPSPNAMSSRGQLPSMVQSWPLHPNVATAYLGFPAPFLTALLCPLTHAPLPSSSQRHVGEWCRVVQPSQCCQWLPCILTSPLTAAHSLPRTHSPIPAASRGRVPQRGAERARHRSAVPAVGSAGGVRTCHAHAPPSQR